MELFELILVLLACVIASSVLARVVSRVSLPLIQILVGFVVALLFPIAAHVSIDSELFLVLFIAPLLFNEARESSKMRLWKNKWSILSLAIGLVLVTVLVIGFVLNAIVPSIPLAAAFALGAALGPTDAAAVAALGSNVNLSKRQSTLLSGESLINDASGVVSFQFAIAAAVTGAFSAAEATSSFALLFFGGILAGVIMGAVAAGCRTALRRRGLEDTMVHVVYQVFTPFVVFLAAEALHVSGILAVVSCGIVMVQAKPRLTSAADARNYMVSDSVWELIVFLINGVIFTLLGMQLPLAMAPTIEAGFSPTLLIGCVVLITLIIETLRFIWITVMNMIHRFEENGGRRGWVNMPKALHRSLVTTIAGAKGAVTLSIIFTIPLTMSDGAVFPNRDLIIFLAAGVILFTLLLADFALPRLAPKETAISNGDDDLSAATILVLDATIQELREKIAEGKRPEYEPATRLTIARYRARIARERLARENSGALLRDLINEVLEKQQECAQKLQEQGFAPSPDASAPYYSILPAIKASISRKGSHGLTVGLRLRTLRAQLVMRWARVKARLLHDTNDEEQVIRKYYETCRYALELEDAAIKYLEEARKTSDADRLSVIEILIDEHRAARESLWGRIQCELTPTARTAADADKAGHHAPLKGGVVDFDEQIEKTREYADLVDAGALEIELDKIRQFQQEGRIDDGIARQLRENVYLFQMTLKD